MPLTVIKLGRVRRRVQREAAQLRQPGKALAGMAQHGCAAHVELVPRRVVRCQEI